MRNLLTLFFATLFCCSATNAQWSDKTLTFGNLNREYRIYLPAGYNPSSSYPLVLTLHGLGDNMTNFSGIGMDHIADTAKFIVLVPQAISDPLLGAAAWNSGAGMYGLYPNQNVDDAGFLNALIDSTGAAYAVNKNRIYVCGFSMGGYMTERLACQLSNKFAAAASMAGTIGNGISSCNPTRVIPVAHFHGTSDQTVPYVNNTSGIDVDSLIQLWVNRNGCNATPAHVTLPDNAADGYTVDLYIYTGATANAVVEHFKVTGADHVWLTLPNNDISYSLEAWKFFSRYQLNAATGITSVTAGYEITIAPNPAKDEVVITTPFRTCDLTVTDISGKVVMHKTIGEKAAISLNSLTLSGLYFLKIASKDGDYYRKLMVVR